MAIQHCVPVIAAEDEAGVAYLTQQVIQALLAEAYLTPKPGLVDLRGGGAHTDMTLPLMEVSAHSLTETFYQLAMAGWKKNITQTLRQEIGAIGRRGEQIMMTATNGVNTHRGAIWSLGLLICACAVQGGKGSVNELTALAAVLARLEDPAYSATLSKGAGMCQQYHVPGAKEEAQQAFPHITQYALPQLKQSRCHGASEEQARVNALLAIMSSLTDTCILYRGDKDKLTQVQMGAQAILAAGGIHQQLGYQLFNQLEHWMLQERLSPGGAADLLAATLFLDQIASGTD